MEAPGINPFDVSRLTPDERIALVEKEPQRLIRRGQLWARQSGLLWPLRRIAETLRPYDRSLGLDKDSQVPEAFLDGIYFGFGLGNHLLKQTNLPSQPLELVHPGVRVEDMDEDDPAAYAHERGVRLQNFCAELLAKDTPLDRMLDDYEPGLASTIMQPRQFKDGVAYGLSMVRVTYAESIKQRELEAITELSPASADDLDAIEIFLQTGGIHSLADEALRFLRDEDPPA